MTPAVRVRTPCRLHFGMFSFGHADRPQFGGVGAMIDSPVVEVTIRPAQRFSVSGQLSDRVEQFAESAARNWNLRDMPQCEITIQSPPDHVGLGVGTQLGLAVAVGLRQFLHLAELPIEMLADAVGRASRSAVGTYGFQRGGLIVDAGRKPGQSMGRLARRIALPADWRFVLVCPANQRGLAGATEADAFERLPAVPESVTQRLWQLTNDQMLPAVERSECRAFSEAVYRFGRLAGECFAAVQGGPFANDEIAQLVQSIRDFGVPGVGQSSWGPTVFAICASESQAQVLTEWLCERAGNAAFDISIARPNNRGATIAMQNC